MPMTLHEMANTSWTGSAELWLDPAGNAAILCDCTIAVGADAVTYAWTYEGAPQTGRLALRADGADFSDTWHSPTPMPCAAAPAPWALIDVFGTYAAGDGPPWGWRITLAHRPDSDELVLQMTNVKPSGEHGRAVRMIARRR
ncbi:MAG: hypothetical protein IPL61_39250 [Myxococcales bacterium]|nr:hypothetical protein [Myxococcales bacterium]